MVAQVDEQQMPVVALAMDPTRKADRFAYVAEAQRRAIVGTVGVHREVDLSAENVVEKRAPRFTAANSFVNPRSRR
jgi:hypothetical protein